jgi:hypothetical protein
LPHGVVISPPGRGNGRPGAQASVVPGKRIGVVADCVADSEAHAVPRRTTRRDPGIPGGRGGSQRRIGGKVKARGGVGAVFLPCLYPPTRLPAMHWGGEGSTGADIGKAMTGPGRRAVPHDGAASARFPKSRAPGIPRPARGAVQQCDGGVIGNRPRRNGREPTGDRGRSKRRDAAACRKFSRSP